MPLNSNIGRSRSERVGSFCAALCQALALPGCFFPHPQDAPGAPAETEPNPHPPAAASLHPTPGHCDRTASTPANKGPAAAGGKASRASSFQLLLLPFALRHRQGRSENKAFNAGFCAQFEHPGLPWGRGKTGSCLFFREAVKGLRQASQHQREFSARGG